MNRINEQFAVIETFVKRDSYYKEQLQDILRKHVSSVYVESPGKTVQLVHTPWALCKEIVDKLKTFTCLEGKSVLVLNVEFLPYVQDAAEVWFVADNKEKGIIANVMYPKCKIVEGYEIDKDGHVQGLFKDKNMAGKKFDVVVGNPPYNSQNEREPLWVDFVKLILKDLLVENGWMCIVHPANWRRVEHELNGLLFTRQIEYIEIHNQADGQRVFGAGTRYDWYILHNTVNSHKTIVVDEKGKKHQLDLTKIPFLPNYALETFQNILAKNGDVRCPVIFSSSAYETRQEWTSANPDKEFKYELIHCTPSSGIRYWYSSRNDKGHFGIPKVIFGDTGIYHVVEDYDGKYGMTQDAIGITISTKDEGSGIKKALLSDKFQEFLDAMKWTGFKVNWRMFKYFRRDWWKEFV